MSLVFLRLATMLQILLHLYEVGCLLWFWDLMTQYLSGPEKAFKIFHLTTSISPAKQQNIMKSIAQIQRNSTPSTTCHVPRTTSLHSNSPKTVTGKSSEQVPMDCYNASPTYETQPYFYCESWDETPNEDLEESISIEYNQHSSSMKRQESSQSKELYEKHVPNSTKEYLSHRPPLICHSLCVPKTDSEDAQVIDKNQSIHSCRTHYLCEETNAIKHAKTGSLSPKKNALKTSKFLEIKCIEESYDKEAIQRYGKHRTEVPLFVKKKNKKHLCSTFSFQQSPLHSFLYLRYPKHSKKTAIIKQLSFDLKKQANMIYKDYSVSSLIALLTINLESENVVELPVNEGFWNHRTINTCWAEYLKSVKFGPYPIWNIIPFSLPKNLVQKRCFHKSDLQISYLLVVQYFFFALLSGFCRVISSQLVPYFQIVSFISLYVAMYGILIPFIATRRIIPHQNCRLEIKLVSIKFVVFLMKGSDILLRYTPLVKMYEEPYEKKTMAIAWSCFLVNLTMFPFIFFSIYAFPSEDIRNRHSLFHEKRLELFTTLLSNNYLKQEEF